MIPMKTEMKEVKKVSKKLSSIAGADMEKTHGSGRASSKMNVTAGTKLEGTVDEIERDEIKIEENTEEASQK